MTSLYDRPDHRCLPSAAGDQQLLQQLGWWPW